MKPRNKMGNSGKYTNISTTTHTTKANPIINYSNYFHIIYTMLHAIIMLYMEPATSLMPIDTYLTFIS